MKSVTTYWLQFVRISIFSDVWALFKTYFRSFSCLPCQLCSLLHHQQVCTCPWMSSHYNKNLCSDLVFGNYSSNIYSYSQLTSCFTVTTGYNIMVRLRFLWFIPSPSRMKLLSCPNLASLLLSIYFSVNFH